ncbi:AAA family ATPase [Arundinibacter roseus]|uniref:MgsA AAA+ ATPase C-terminal domain-containing protein n=1 Tax=Arundinibacter roseus TaxID=2070510 RepID=A0A4R4KGJ8_9BACT|nr:hypothetical protein [Arundinibacter roseus]TDB66813.1 hypothetical protein EZE20_06720 [Arundinibacter roseus]TDB67122.1 hypothetical protein EZE20_08390 [Arundinibacter roseus]
MGKYDITTVNGYDFFEISSAMQKCIRRGLEEEALYWAVELYNSGYSEYVWKRLRIMSSEDVGLANPSISSEIWALYSMFKEQAKKKEDKNEPQRLFMTHAIFILCRSRKSRLIDWALIWAWMSHKIRRLDVPDFAYDKHNERGRMLKRGWGHFFREGAKLENPADVYLEDEYKRRAMKAIEDPDGMGLF